MNLKKTIIILLMLALIFTLANYGPAWYTGLIDEGGSGVKYMHFKSSPEILLDKVLAVKRSDKTMWPPNETRLCEDNFISSSNQVYIKIYDGNKYYHMWVPVPTNSTKEENSLLVFGGTSITPDKKDLVGVNYMTSISQWITMDNFKSLLLNKIDVERLD